VRDILNLAGVKDVTAKVLGGTKNKLNNSKAVIEALSQISSKYKKVVPETTVVNNKEVSKVVE
jgi:ribosomal protein S5